MSKMSKTKTNHIARDSRDELSLSHVEINPRQYLSERLAIMSYSLDKEHQNLVRNLCPPQLNSLLPHLFRRPGFWAGIERAKKIKMSIV